jgi:hypothetical protein
MAIAALFVPALVGALATAMGTLAGRAIIALGIGFVTYKGIDLSIAAMKDAAINSIKGLPVDALNLVGYLWLDKGITVIISAVAVALSMKALGGSVKKMVLK